MSALTVLNVDDKAGNRYLKSRVLRSAGFDVVEAADGRSALSAAQERAPDAVLLDLKLPDISGFEVCRMLKSDPRTRSIPVVHISSTFTGERTRSDSAQAGAEIYLAEPVAPHELTSALRTVLRLRVAEHRLARTQAELEAALEQARAAQRAAEEAGRMKDEFLALLSHELRTPMAAILGWLHVARGGRLSPPQLAQALAVVERNAQAQVRLVDDLLDLSRIITGKLEIEAEPAALDAVLRDAVDSVRVAAAERRVAVTLELAGGPWALRGSARRLGQVFGNLLANALKFSREGGVVEVRAERAGGEALVSVRDEGEGIPAQLLPHVFETFRQLEGTTRARHGGLGLGLAIVKSLVEAHGGSVEARSAGEGQGATLVVRLPLDEADAGAPGDASAGEAPASLADAPLQGLRVLLVEDHADQRAFMEEVLAAGGAAVRSAAGAEAALGTIAGWRPDVLVLDIAMPEVDGYQLLARLRQALGAHADALPAVAATAFASAADAMRARESGFQAHLAKPLAPAELVRTVAALAHRPAARDA